ncbi:hypothetical protein LIER_21562 [Lithospermum erythrorhizon]|uniref:Uncharacterized protein n=1 Tax=Lithospermum erythrorhizon TaxID=34254 RepID=A0AAV3QQT7_LITER
MAYSLKDIFWRISVRSLGLSIDSLMYTTPSPMASGGDWVEELPTVLLSFRSTPNHATREAPFSLVYGTEVVLPAEVGLPTYRQVGFDKGKNDWRLKEFLNLTDELRDEGLYKILKYKHLGWFLQPTGQKPPVFSGRLATYELEDLEGKPIPRAWHASKLTRYYV